MSNNKVYEIITDRIVEMLKDGNIPWKQPWKMGKPPLNLVSKKNYRGINILMLAGLGYSSPYFLSYKQAKQLKGNVKSGEKGFPVIFWQMYKIKDDDKEKKDKTIPLLRYYTVFNLEQCEGIDESKIPSIIEKESSFTPIEHCQSIFDNMPNRPDFKFNGGRACYTPSIDTVGMPRQELFGTESEYYSTLFHEITHATGHESRLCRDGITNGTFFGSHSYSKEELIAEMGAAMLCGVTGIENSTIDNSAAYIQNWLSKLENDKKLLIKAAGLAQKAADYIMNKGYDSKGNQVPIKNN